MANSQSATEEATLESGISNAALAAAATKEPLAGQTSLLQSSYGNAAVAQALVQRKPEGEEVAGITPALAEEQQSTEEQSATGTSAAPAASLIVEDSAETLMPGQMRKSEFLSQLRASVSNTASEALADTPWSEAGCPYIDKWFAYYNAQDSQHLERAIRRYAAEAASAIAASSYIPIVTGRVRRSVTTWATTGEVTGLPEIGPPGAGVIGAVAGAVSGIASAASEVIAGVGSIFFKEREGGAKEADDPQAIQAQLGAGQSLDADVKSRMEGAFGESFSGVEVHTDGNAAGVSSSLNARALTVGKHIAFGAGEYRPGTPVGDALIAHELAHVAQQRGGGASVESKQNGMAGYNALEEDADASAVGAVVSLWGGMKGSLAGVARNAMPRLKTGLKLQSCKSGSKEKEKKTDKLTDAEIEGTTEYKTYMDPKLQWQTTHKMTRDEALLAYRLIVRTRAEGKTVTWPADAETFMNLARKQLGTLKQAEGLKGKLEWVQVTGEMVEGRTPWESDFGKWLVAGGPEPDSTTGKVNCWEMVLFSAYKGGYIARKRIEDIYNEGVKKEKDGTRIFPDTIVKELRRGNEYVLDPKDPNSPEPLPGDIVIFTEAANHVAIALGTKDGSGRHRIISHWPPPDGSYKTKETTIEELLALMRPGNVVKFWSPGW
ncbi:MAG: DUF4157 domain-containing protein [Blastocatellia bacterium]